jgi:hypothetical protein
MVTRPLTFDFLCACKSGREERGTAGSGDLGFHDLSAVVVTAGGANVVRTFQLATVRTLGIAARRQRVVSAALVASRLRYLTLGNRHDSLLSTQTQQSGGRRFLAKFPGSGKSGSIAADPKAAA